MNLTKLGTLTSAVAAMSLLAAGTALATPTISVQDSGGVSFPVLNLGTATTAGWQSSAEIDHPSFGIASIVFSGGSASADPNHGSGLYAGSVGSVATTPFPVGAPGNSLADYLVAQANGGTVTITFNAPQTSLDLLWGTADAAPGYNVVACGNTSCGGIGYATITGQDILAAAGGSVASGSTNFAVEVTGMKPFTSLTFSDGTTSSAFEFAISSVPEPASLALMALGLAGLGFASRRRNRSRSRA